MQVNFQNNYITPDFGRTIKRKTGSFGISHTVKLNTPPCLLTKAGAFFKKTYFNALNKEMGQNTSNFINYAGKALISPLIIFAIAPFTDENKESLKNAALLHPIQAVLSFFTAIGSSFAVNKILDIRAKKGILLKTIDPELGEFFNSNTLKGKQNLAKLKNISTLGLTVAAVPISGMILNAVLPYIIKNTRINGLNKKNEDKSRKFKLLA